MAPCGLEAMNHLYFKVCHPSEEIDNVLLQLKWNLFINTTECIKGRSGLMECMYLELYMYKGRSSYPAQIKRAQLTFFSGGII